MNWRITPQHVHGAAVSFTLVVLWLTALFTDEIALFSATLLVAASMGAMFVVLMLWHLDVSPSSEAELQPIKSAIADYASFWGGTAFLLVLLVTGKG